jgi:hypothetical protein
MLSCGKSGDSLGEDVCAPSVVVGAAQDVLRVVLPRELWSRVDGGEDELFYVGPDGAVMEVLVEARDGKWSAGAPARLLEGRYFTGAGTATRHHDVTADGQRFLIIKNLADAGASPQIIVVQNWFEELKELVPVN